MKKNIAVVYGGDSDEWIISKKSAKTVFTHLDRSKYEVFLIRIQGNEWLEERENDAVVKVNREDFSFLRNGKKVKVDAAFIVIHGTPGEDGKLQGYFDMIHLPYSTCNQLVSSITFHKGTTIRMLKSHGFNCSNSLVLNKKRNWTVEMVLEQVKIPCFVKPNSGGSSFGISKVSRKDELEGAIRKAFVVDDEVMVEELMVGREVTCGAYSYKGEIKVFPVTEIITKNEFFDYAAKYEGESEEITPAAISSELTDLIKNTTKNIYQKMNLSGLIRVDYILQNEQPFVIEINTTPGLSENSLIPQQAKVEGLELSELFDRITQEMLSMDER